MEDSLDELVEELAEHGEANARTQTGDDLHILSPSLKILKERINLKKFNLEPSSSLSGAGGQINGLIVIITVRRAIKQIKGGHQNLTVYDLWDIKINRSLELFG